MQEREAFSVVNELRQNGETAELDIASMDIEKAKAYAKNKGIKRIITIDRDGNTDTIARSINEKWDFRKEGVQ